MLLAKMLLRKSVYEEIEWVSECVDSIDETEIKFNDKINALDDAQLKSIEQYVHE